MNTCECRCGERAESGGFLPGHDQKLRINLEGRVGGLLVMRELVDAMESYVQGRTSLDELGRVVRSAFWRKRGAV